MGILNQLECLGHTCALLARCKNRKKKPKAAFSAMISGFLKESQDKSGHVRQVYNETVDEIRVDIRSN